MLSPNVTHQVQVEVPIQLHADRCHLVIVHVVVVTVVMPVVMPLMAVVMGVAVLMAIAVRLAVCMLVIMLMIVGVCVIVVAVRVGVGVAAAALNLLNDLQQTMTQTCDPSLLPCNSKATIWHKGQRPWVSKHQLSFCTFSLSEHAK